jgi:hypothetical protein
LGEILKALAELERLDDTIIVFTTEAENLKDCVAVVEDSVFGKEWDGR